MTSRSRYITFPIIGALLLSALLVCVSPAAFGSGAPQAITLVGGDMQTGLGNVTYGGVPVAAGNLLEIRDNATDAVLDTFTMGIENPPGTWHGGHFYYTTSINDTDLPKDIYVRAYNAPTVGAATATGDSDVYTITGAGEYWLAGWELQGTATHLNLTVPPSIPPDSAFSVTVTVYDATWVVASDYEGTVHFTSSDGLAVLPGDYTFTVGDAGSHTFDGLKLYTAPTQWLNVTDVAAPTLTDQETLAIGVGPADTLELTAPATAVAGQPFALTVTARDQWGNVASGYNGTVHFASSDGTAMLPADYAFTAGDAGSHTFTGISMTNDGAQTIWVECLNDSSLNGSASITVVHAGADHFQLLCPGTADTGQTLTVILRVLDIYNNVVANYSETVRFTSSDGLADLPGDYLFSQVENGVHTFTDGVTFNTAGAQTLNVTAISGSAITIEKTVTVTDVTAPDEPLNLTLALDSGNVVLNWTASTSPDLSHYLVFRSANGTYDYDAPHHNTTGDVDPLAVNWTDAGAAAGGTYYYVVRAVDAAWLQSADSNQACKFALSLASEWNMISIPLELENATLDAVCADLQGGQYQSDSDRVLSWDAANGKWLVAYKYEVGGPLDGWYFAGDSFEFEQDRAYWIQVRPAHPNPTLQIPGAVAEGQRNVPIVEGWNFVGYSGQTSVKLEVGTIDSSGLYAGGLTGAELPTQSDQVYHYDGASYVSNYIYESTTFPANNGTWMGQNVTLEPGNGYWIRIRDGHPGFTWTYNV